jgi:hypothetical protein
MKVVIWQDSSGLKHRSLLRNHDSTDTTTLAKHISDPPDVVGRIDWEQVARALHNQLVERGLFTWDDVQAQSQGLPGAILSALRLEVTKLYREVRT